MAEESNVVKLKKPKTVLKDRRPNLSDADIAEIVILVAIYPGANIQLIRDSFAEENDGRQLRSSDVLWVVNTYREEIKQKQQEYEDGGYFDVLGSKEGRLRALSELYLFAGSPGHCLKTLKDESTQKLVKVFGPDRAIQLAIVKAAQRIAEGPQEVYPSRKSGESSGGEASGGEGTEEEAGATEEDDEDDI